MVTRMMVTVAIAMLAKVSGVTLQLAVYVVLVEMGAVDLFVVTPCMSRARVKGLCGIQPRLVVVVVMVVRVVVVAAVEASVRPIVVVAPAAALLLHPGLLAVVVFAPQSLYP